MSRSLVDWLEARDREDRPPVVVEEAWRLGSPNAPMPSVVWPPGLDICDTRPAIIRWFSR